jgi:elongation factor Ts
MAESKSALIRGLREKSGAGMLDCKRALDESDGDINKAMDWLRARGQAIAKQKSSRAARQGRIHSYIHHTGTVGVLLEINCETDFVARNPEFQALATDISMHIAARSPSWVAPENIPADVIDKEKEIYRSQALNEDKPEKIVDRIAEGKLKKYYEDNCLLSQPFVRDEDVTVGDQIKQVIAKVGENIVVRRFARYQLGETLESEESA